MRCCNREIPDGAKYCPWCGKSPARERGKKRRGNGTGSVYRLPSGKYRGAVTIGQWADEDGKLHRKVNSRNFATKKEAVAWVASPEARQERRKELTLKELHDLWAAQYTSGGKSAVGVYKAAFDKFKVLWPLKLDQITIDDLQECIDVCQRGKQTRENMKTVVGLIYKYGIPRKLVPDNLNLAQYLKAGGTKGEWREGIPLDCLDLIRECIGTVPRIEYVYCHCYLGFRPGELLALDCRNYDRKQKTITGGMKTEAGRNRTVTISPKIQPIIDRLTADRIAGPIFPGDDGKPMTKQEYAALFDLAIETIGLANPEMEMNGRVYRKYTPHSCRHTFATLMKNVSGAAGDKMALIGHANEAQLRDYEDINLADLRKITDAI